MAIKKQKFFEIINEVGESGGLDEDNLLERIKNELKGKDEGEYNKFSKNFSKEHQFIPILIINEPNKKHSRVV
ncbi:hypothetical protein [Wolbachia endosymbiont of Tetranychus urticae]|uniref:hypothetical protein n=1 Tax=Wolbachia endosymbiont of Tetranychus urticae TaxID=169184 RepID=UPI00397ADA77